MYYPNRKLLMECNMICQLEKNLPNSDHPNSG